METLRKTSFPLRKTQINEVNLRPVVASEFNLVKVPIHPSLMSNENDIIGNRIPIVATLIIGKQQIYRVGPKHIDMKSGFISFAESQIQNLILPSEKHFIKIKLSFASGVFDTSNSNIFFWEMLGDGLSSLNDSYQESIFEEWSGIQNNIYIDCDKKIENHAFMGIMFERL